MSPRWRAPISRRTEVAMTPDDPSSLRSLMLPIGSEERLLLVAVLRVYSVLVVVPAGADVPQSDLVRSWLRRTDPRGESPTGYIQSNPHVYRLAPFASTLEGLKSLRCVRFRDSSFETTVGWASYTAVLYAVPAYLPSPRLTCDSRTRVNAGRCLQRPLQAAGRPHRQRAHPHKAESHASAHVQACLNQTRVHHHHRQGRRAGSRAQHWG